MELDQNMSEVVHGSDEVREMFCEPCHRDESRQVHVKGFCTVCKEYICAVCIRYHRRYQPEHVVQDKEDMPKDFCLDLCKFHSREIAKFYCETCSNVACSQCKTNRHQNCHNLQYLPAVSANFEKSTELKILEGKIKKATKNICSVENIITSGNKCVKKLSRDVTEAVKRQKNQMNLQFDKFEAEIQNKVIKMKKDDLSMLKKKSDMVKTVKRELTTLQSDIINMKRTSQRCRLFTKTKRGNKDVDMMTEKLAHVENEIVIHDYVYEPVVEYATQERMPGSLRTEGETDGTLTSADLTSSLISSLYLETRATFRLVQDLSRAQKCFFTVLMALLAVLDIKNILIYMSFIFATGVFYKIVMRTRFNDIENKLIRFLLSAFIKAISKLLKSRGELFSILQISKQLPKVEINVKSSGEKTCDITSLCCISLYMLAAADKDNCSVKIIDTQQKKVVEEFSLSDAPWDITTAGDNQLAVTMPYSRTVCFLLFECKFGSHAISQIRSILVNCICYGIIHLDRKLIISSRDPVGVRIFDMDGNLMECFDINSSSEILFEDPFYITMSPDETTLYVSDYRTGRVTRLSIGGNVLSVFRESGLTDLFGMCVDGTGNVYVCGARCVYKLTADLAAGQKHIECDTMPNSIVYFQESDEVVIASYMQNTIEINHV